MPYSSKEVIIILDIVFDYSLDAEARKELVEKYLENRDPAAIPQRTLEAIADYLIFSSLDKTARHEKKILTDNRMVTINRHETSYQGIADSLETGEDGIYNLIAENGKNTYITNRVQITDSDIAANPDLQSLRDSISRVKEAAASATSPHDKKVYKKWLTDLYRDQYVIKNNFHHTPQNSLPVHSSPDFSFTDDIKVTPEGKIVDNSTCSFFNVHHVSLLLQNYTHLKEAAEADFCGDCAYMMQDLDALINRVLGSAHPILNTLLTEKIRGTSNVEIQQRLRDLYNTTYSIEYISVLWRNKIPRLLVEQATKDYLEWYYTFCEYGKWKKCSRCGQIKLAHSLFFSKNKSSKDGFYSICKECRSKHCGEGDIKL